jgi:hypothetical protein
VSKLFVLAALHPLDDYSMVYHPQQLPIQPITFPSSKNVDENFAKLSYGGKIINSRSLASNCFGVNIFIAN